MAELKHRNAVPEDIIRGAFFLMHGDDGLYLVSVEDVHDPSDQFKAFTGNDGCRYGLDGLFVFNPLASVKMMMCQNDSCGDYLRINKMSIDEIEPVFCGACGIKMAKVRVEQ